MPSVSGDQQRFMAAAFQRKAQGQERSTDPQMSLRKLHDFTRKVPGAPDRKPQSRYGGPPVGEHT